MTAQGRDGLFAGGRVPQLDRPVGADRRQHFSIGRKADLVHEPSVRMDGPLFPALDDVPKLQLKIPRGIGEVLVIGREVCCENTAIVLQLWKHGFTGSGFNIPQAGQLSILPPDQHSAFVRRFGHRNDPSAADLNSFARLGGPAIPITDGSIGRAIPNLVALTAGWKNVRRHHEAAQRFEVRGVPPAEFKLTAIIMRGGSERFAIQRKTLQ